MCLLLDDLVTTCLDNHAKNNWPSNKKKCDGFDIVDFAVIALKDNTCQAMQIVPQMIFSSFEHSVCSDLVGNRIPAVQIKP